MSSSWSDEVVRINVRDVEVVVFRMLQIDASAIECFTDVTASLLHPIDSYA